ncbi:MAG: hypothetical protein RIR97_1443, partial [Pseudomonadota bacterium]
IAQDAAVTPQNTDHVDTRQTIHNIIRRVNDFLKLSQVVVPGSADLDISHHYGLDHENRTMP